MRIGRATRNAAAMALAACAATVATAQGATVEFVRPKEQATVVGRSTIEIRVNLPEGLRVRSLTLSADAKPIAVLEDPPWTAIWDFGDGSRAHALQAVVLLSDGTERRTSVRTSRLRVDHVEQVDLVNLYAVVRDANGVYAAGLTKDSFHLTEDGRPEAIERFSDEWKPLRVGLVIDTSLSMEGDKLEAARRAASSFLDVLRPEDQGCVLAFNDGVTIVQGMTDDRDLLRRAIAGVRAKGGTALYDAIWKAAEILEPEDGRRVIVLLSDGRDEASSGLEPGSLHTDREALERALRGETIVFAIGIGRNLAAEWDFYRRRSLQAILEELAEATGGRALFSSRTAKLQRAFEEVAEDLRHQYSLAYTSDNTRRDGGWREIRLTAAEPALRVITRKGYYAPRAAVVAAPAQGSSRTTR